MCYTPIARWNVFRERLESKKGGSRWTPHQKCSESQLLGVRLLPRDYLALDRAGPEATGTLFFQPAATGSGPFVKASVPEPRVRVVQAPTGPRHSAKDRAEEVPAAPCGI